MPDVAAALADAAADFAALARGADDPTRRVRATPEWTVADLVTHVAIEADRYRREVDGEGEWSASVTAIAETNRQALAAHVDRDVERALEWLDRSVARYVETLRTGDLDARTHHLDGGILLTNRQAAGLLLGELTVHRRDLARATRQRTSIDPERAALTMHGAMHMLPAMVDHEAARGHTGTYEVRVRGHATYTVRVVDGEVAVDDGGAGTGAGRDVVLSVDPVGFLLSSYRRRGPVATALRGHVLAWGRRPWRAAALDRLFHRI